MKSIIRKYACFLCIVVTFFTVGCSNKNENEEIMNFYLSQPRDPELVGWWERQAGGDEGKVTYKWFRKDGTAIMNMTYRNGILTDATGTDYRYAKAIHYWYAKDGVYHTFDRNDGWLKGWSPQSETRYEIRGDELWIDNKPEWVLSGKRTEPKL